MMKTIKKCLLFLGRHLGGRKDSCSRSSNLAPDHLPSDLPLSLYAELYIAILFTGDESVLELLSRQPWPPGSIGKFWQAAWEARAKDWKAPWARRLAWQTLLQKPYQDEDNLRLFREVSDREHDWHVLHMLAFWVPSGRHHRQELADIWRRHLKSRYPVLRLLASDALMNLDMNCGAFGKTVKDIS